MKVVPKRKGISPGGNRLVFIAAVILLFLLFLDTAVSKLTDLDKFRRNIESSPFISPYSHFLVWGIPFAELITAGALIFKTTRLAGLYLSVFLMSLFTAYVYAMLHFSPYLPCSCAGVLESMSWQQHLIFNMTFLVISVLATVKYRQNPSLSVVK